MILEKVKKVFADYKDMDVNEITSETTFADLQLDSLDSVEIIMNLEEEFDITIQMDDGINNVGDIVKQIEKAQA